MTVLRHRAWLIGWTALSLTAVLLGAGAEPARAESGKPDFPPLYSACVGPAVESAGFRDAAGSFAEDEINCIFHYGITRGRTADRFSAGETITRWQMALFLARGARPAGIVLPASPRPEGFRDIGGLSREAQWAINALAGAGIMPGASAVSFEPNRGITRASMADLLDAFLTEAVIGEGGWDPEKIVPDDDVFTDLDRVSFHTYNAIRRIYELGITTGQTETRFAPEGLVTRAQMAAFLARTLSHTIARPAGLSMQSSADEVSGSEGAVELLVSVRDQSFGPVTDAAVDLFYSDEPGAAFRSDGTCNTARVTAVEGGRPCVIDYGDPLTDEFGDIVGVGHAPVAATTLWAWTGELQSRFDDDTTASQSLELGYVPAPTQMLVTDDLAPNQEKLKLGQTVTFVLQIADADGDPVEERDWEVTVAAAETGAGGDFSSLTRVYRTDGSGQIRFAFRQSGTSAAGETARATLQVSDVATRRGQPSLPVVDKTTNRRIPTDAVTADGDDADSDPDPHPDRGKYVAEWSEAPSAPGKLTITQRTSHTAASDEGRGAVNRVTARLTDQYGVPIRGKRIRLFSDDRLGLGGYRAGETSSTPLSDLRGLLFTEADGKRIPAAGSAARYTRTTNSRGEAAFSYFRDADESGIETIWAAYNEVVGTPDGADDRPAGDGDDIALTAERIYHHWTETPGSGKALGRILEKDTVRNQLVIAAPERTLLVEYDGNDQFNAADGEPATFADFEKALSGEDSPDAAHLRINAYSGDTLRVSSFTLGSEWADRQHPSGREAGGAARFGQVVAADGNVLVIGAGYEDIADDRDTPDPADDVTAARAGKVYVHPAGIATPAARVVELAAPSPAADGLFGFDADIAGNTLVIGEPGARKVYVYVRGDDGVWPTAPAAALSPGSGAGVPAAASSLYGTGVAVSGDGSVIAVTMPWNGTAPAQNAVVVYEKPGSGWADDADAADNPLLRDDDLGLWRDRSVAISHDGSTIVIGSPNWSPAAPDAGSAGVFVEPMTGWASAADADATLKAPVASSHQKMGESVAVSSDGATVVASGHFDPGQTDQAGVVYVFGKPAGGWTDGIPPAILKAGRGRADDALGRSVAVTGDGSEVAAGRHFRQEGDWRGSVAIFKRDGAAWASQTGLDEEYLGAAPDKQLGWTVAYDRTNGTLYATGREEKAPNRYLDVFRINR